MAQKQSKCYCNSVGSTCCYGNVNCMKNKKLHCPTKSFSVTNKKEKQKQSFYKKTTETNKQKKDFIKINRKAVKVSNRKGLGHSQVQSKADFSRRNSAATIVTFSTSTCSSAADDADAKRSICTTTATTPTLKTTPYSSPLTKLKSRCPVTIARSLNDQFRAMCVSSKREEGYSKFGSALQPEFTEQRRSYENVKQLMKLISSDSDTFSTLSIASSGASAGGGNEVNDGEIYMQDMPVDAERLRMLQKFRLQNADDCFSVYRQMDLKLPLQKKDTESQYNKQQKRNLYKNLIEQQTTSLSDDGGNGLSKLVKDAKCTQMFQSETLKQIKNQCNELGTKKKDASMSLTPYVIRQKLLQLRMEADEVGRMKPGRKLYGALGNSFALRYHEMF